MFNKATYQELLPADVPAAPAPEPLAGPPVSPTAETKQDVYQPGRRFGRALVITSLTFLVLRGGLGALALNPIAIARALPNFLS